MNNFIEQYWVDDNTIDCLSELANNCNELVFFNQEKLVLMDKLIQL